MILLSLLLRLSLTLSQMASRFERRLNLSLFDTVGVGDHIHNYVYRFAPWKDLGCWRDTGDGRTMTLLANFRRKIDWFHMEKTGRYKLLSSFK